jgi:hypothetical protein
MADWYLSSVAYDAVAAWLATHTYAVGAIVRQTSLTLYAGQRCFRASAITTGISGGTEPTWNLGLGATTTDGGVTWTECTGNSAHQHDNSVTNTWTAPGRHFENFDSTGNAAVAAGDRIFVSSDHAEVITTSGHVLLTAGSNASPVNCISVSRTAGNIPPLAADITAGAAVSCSAAGGTLFLSNAAGSRFEGLTFTVSGTGTCKITIPNSGAGVREFKDCNFVISGTGSASSIDPCAISQCTCIWQNCTVKFGAVGQSIWLTSTSKLHWKNTAGIPAVNSAGSAPTNLFTDGNSGAGKGGVFLDGLDLSFVAGNIFGTIVYLRGIVRNCKLNASATLAALTSAAYGNTHGEVYGLEFINCHSSNDAYNNYWAKYGGTIATEITITRTGGATDGVQKASRKMVSSSSTALVNKALPLEHHIYLWNTVVGTSQTATVEVISSASLNNDELWGEIEYLGDSADCMSLFADDTIATTLTAAAAQTSSSVAWDSSPATPVKQKLAITFTAQKVGLLDFVVKLAKASTTVYVDHKITLT